MSVCKGRFQTFLRKQAHLRFLFRSHLKRMVEQHAKDQQQSERLKPEQQDHGEASDPYTREYFVLLPISHDSRMLMHTIATAENTAPGSTRCCGRRGVGSR